MKYRIDGTYLTSFNKPFVYILMRLPCNFDTVDGIWNTTFLDYTATLPSCMGRCAYLPTTTHESLSRCLLAEKLVLSRKVVKRKSEELDLCHKT